MDWADFCREYETMMGVRCCSNAIERHRRAMRRVAEFGNPTTMAELTQRYIRRFAQWLAAAACSPESAHAFCKQLDHMRLVYLHHHVPR